MTRTDINTILLFEPMCAYAWRAHMHHCLCVCASGLVRDCNGTEHRAALCTIDSASTDDSAPQGYLHWVHCAPLKCLVHHVVQGRPSATNQLTVMSGLIIPLFCRYCTCLLVHVFILMFSCFQLLWRRNKPYVTWMYYLTSCPLMMRDARIADLGG